MNANNPDYELLVDPERLSANLSRDDWCVLDCRFDLKDPAAGLRLYRESHIPGAVFADLDRDLSSPPTASSGRHPLPSPSTLAETFGGLGIDNDCQVVVYDAAGGALAARAWWLLRWLGHERVALLDGGLPAWAALGLPLESGEVQPSPRHFTPAPRHDRVVDTTSVEARVSDGQGMLLLDARDAPRFRGEVEPIDPVAGHIPGAVNLPFSEQLDEEQRFLDADQLGPVWQSRLGAHAGRHVVAMCGSGVTACHLVVGALLAGLDEPAVYVGSWSEWIRDASRPVGTGDHT